MIRDFMPGECTLGPNAAVFNKMDQDPEVVVQNPQLVEVARSICRLECSQLPDCGTQRAGIVDVLSARGIGRTVVGGEIVERVEPTEPDPVLNEPAFNFDLTNAPYDLPLIRQAWRGRQVPKTIRVKHEDLTRAHLSEDLTNKMPELEDAVRDMIVGTVTRAFLIYRYVRLGCDLSRAAIMAEAELADARAMQDGLSKAVIYFKKAGFAEPGKRALLHTPAFFEAFMNRHMGAYGLTRSQIVKMFNNYVDPLTAMKNWRLDNQQAREAVNRQETDEASLAPEHSRTAGIRAVIQEGGLRRYNPKLQPYMGNIAKKKGADHKGEARALSKRFKDLRARHSDVDESALAYIAYYRQEDPDSAVQTFRDVYAELQVKYGEDHPDCSLTQLRRYSFRNATLEGAVNAVKNHLQIAEKIRSLATPEQIASAIFKEFMYYYTSHCTDINKIDAQTVDFEYKKRLLRRSKLKVWIVDGIAGLYEIGECKEAAQSVATFLNRGYLQTALALEDTPPAYNLIDTVNGRYLEWGKELSAFSIQEQEAILATFKLDRLILGRTVNTEALEHHFQVDNLERFVTTYLLPYSLAPASQPKTGGATVTLEGIRSVVKDGDWRRSARDGHKDKADRALAVLLSDLADDGVEFGSKACKQGVRDLLRHVGRISSWKLGKRWELLRCTRAYLHEAQQIEALDIAPGDPYQVALGHSAAFCSYFLGLVDKDFTKSRAVTILQRPTMQAMVDLRLFQKNIRVYEARFSQRGISRGFWIDRAFAYRRNPQFLDNALGEYDTLRSKFPNVSKAAVDHFCFKTGKKKNSEAEIEDWLESIRQLAPAYKQAVSRENIEQTAYTNRGDQLAKVLAGRIRIIDDIMRENEAGPHPGIGREVIEYAVFRRVANPRKWLSDEYLARWKYIEEHENTNGIQLPILRRLVLFDTKKPGNMVKLYKSLRMKYEGDLYITPAIIDGAIRTNPLTAMASLSRIRKTKQNDKAQAYAFSESGTDPRGMSNNDTALSPEDIVVGKLEGVTREQRMIADLLKPATAMEKAVVAVAYNTSWLAPDDMRDERHGEVVVRPLFTHYNVRSIRELKPVADAILKRLAAAKR